MSARVSLRARLAFVALLAVLLAAVPAVADAKFTRSTSAASAISTDVLSPPADLTVTRDCGFFSPYVTVSWTPTSDAYSTGYTLTISHGSTTTTQAITGRTTTIVSINIGFYTATTFTVTSTYRSWSSRSAGPTSAVQCGFVS